MSPTRMRVKAEEVTEKRIIESSLEQLGECSISWGRESDSDGTTAFYTILHKLLDDQTPHFTENGEFATFDNWS